MPGGVPPPLLSNLMEYLKEGKGGGEGGSGGEGEGNRKAIKASGANDSNERHKLTRGGSLQASLRRLCSSLSRGVRSRAEG